VDRQKYQIQIPLPPKIDPSVTMMTVEEKPDITYRLVSCYCCHGHDGILYARVPVACCLH